MKEYVNDITRDMDECLHHSLIKLHYEFGLNTYILSPTKEALTNKKPTVDYVFRYPGATRGHIEVDKKTNIIVDIKFYDTAIRKFNDGNVGCYTKHVKDLIMKYVGTRLTLEEG